MMQSHQINTLLSCDLCRNVWTWISLKCQLWIQTFHWYQPDSFFSCYDLYSIYLFIFLSWLMLTVPFWCCVTINLKQHAYLGILSYESHEVRQLYDEYLLELAILHSRFSIWYLFASHFLLPIQICVRIQCTYTRHECRR